MAQGLGYPVNWGQDSGFRVWACVLDGPVFHRVLQGLAGLLKFR